MKRITTRHQLVELATELRVRPDWHEPDEQGVSARVFGQDFDNAMAPAMWYGTRGDDEPHAEQYVVLYRQGIAWDDQASAEPEALAAINLATLFAWACEETALLTPDGQRRTAWACGCLVNEAGAHRFGCSDHPEGVSGL